VAADCRDEELTKHRLAPGEPQWHLGGVEKSIHQFTCRARSRLGGAKPLDIRRRGRTRQQTRDDLHAQGTPPAGVHESNVQTANPRTRSWRSPRGRECMTSVVFGPCLVP
jgi:hypothetical protein